MSNLLIKQIPRELLARVGYRAKMLDMTQREWVIALLERETQDLEIREDEVSD